MPLYEYQCNKCGKIFEQLASYESIPACPSCGSKETEKKVTCCARHKRGNSSKTTMSYSGGCGSCSGGNCASCGR